MTNSPRILFVAVTLLAAAVGPFAQGVVGDALTAGDPSKPAVRHRIVVEVTNDGIEQWTMALNNVENLRKTFGTESTQIEVVGHGKGLGIMLARNAALADRMRKLFDGGVVFAACENSMRKHGVTKADLHPFATTVDSGVAEVVRKQEAGWSYLKTCLLYTSDAADE